MARFSRIVLLGLLPLLLAAASAAEPPAKAGQPANLPLWPNGAPGSEGKSGDEAGQINELSTQLSGSPVSGDSSRHRAIDDNTPPVPPRSGRPSPPTLPS